MFLVGVYIIIVIIDSVHTDMITLYINELSYQTCFVTGLVPEDQAISVV